MTQFMGFHHSYVGSRKEYLDETLSVFELHLEPRLCDGDKVQNTSVLILSHITFGPT